MSAELRQKNLNKFESQCFDTLVIGGGINGAVCASALSAKGARVALVERSDFSSCSSSNSSNLAWGGIKYLESGELMLVSKLCRSRNHLMRHYPSSVKEIRFFTTIKKGFRMPAFFVFLGSVFYWLMGACFTKAPRFLTLGRIKREEPVINTDGVAGGLEYSDCYLPDNDSRFVFRFIRKAMEKGCVAANYVEAKGSVFENGEWKTQIKDRKGGDTFFIRSKSIVNACGPFVDQYNALNNRKTSHQHVFSKGVHLIVDRITDHERILAFFASDGRLFFVIPMGPKTCIGTTDTPVENPISKVTEEDRQFILNNANQLLNLKKELTVNDIVSERCGVRPLAIELGDDGEVDWIHLSRKHAIDADKTEKFISIFGGKLTDCVNVGEEVVDLVRDMNLDLALNDSSDRWYGEPSAELKSEFLKKASEFNIDSKVETLSGEPLSERIWRRYGELANSLLDDIKNDSRALEKPIEEIEYTRCELELMAKTEMIITLDDFLRRRSKVSLVLRKDTLMSSSGLEELCTILFGEQANEKYEEYRRKISRL
ncbi:MAG: FAD-dependent oxidoreductase [Cellvibrionaceae bacterium]